jgi:hypothetical protein
VALTCAPVGLACICMHAAPILQFCCDESGNSYKTSDAPSRNISSQNIIVTITVNDNNVLRIRLCCRAHMLMSTTQVLFSIRNDTARHKFKSYVRQIQYLLVYSSIEKLWRSVECRMLRAHAKLRRCGRR